MAVTRGFHPRRAVDDSSRVPPGQYVTPDFPVLSAGPTPRPRLDSWEFTIKGAVEQPVSWSWQEFRALPRETFTVDIHCVTKWTKLDTTWSGVSVDTLLDGVSVGTLLDGVSTPAQFAMAIADGGYTTNIPLDDLRGGRAWVVDEYDGKPLEPEHGGPARLLVPHLISGRARSGSADLSCARPTSPDSGRCSATTIMETRGKNSATTATDLADRHGGRNHPGDAPDENHRVDHPWLDGPPCGTACGCAADSAGRVSGPAQLLHRVRARGRTRDVDGRAARRR